jgi:hypothetical protein
VIPVLLVSITVVPSIRDVKNIKLEVSAEEAGVTNAELTFNYIVEPAVMADLS